MYGKVRLQPAIFQDDIGRMVSSLEAARAGNILLSSLLETKLLSFNLKKTCITILGAKKAREDLLNEFIDTPPTLYGEPVKIVMSGTYLGDELGSTVSESVTLTIEKRMGLAKKAVFDIKNIVEDCRSQVIGGINTGLLLYETSLIPFLLFNSSCWLQMKQSDIDKLQKLQNLFYSTLLQVHKSSVFSLHWELGALLIPMRILKEKVLLYWHISSLSENALAKTMMKIKDGIQSFLNESEIYDVEKYSEAQFQKNR